MLQQYADQIETGVSGSNAALDMDLPVRLDGRYHLCSYEVVIKGAAASNDMAIVISAGGVTIWQDVVVSGAPTGTRVFLNFTQPLRLPPNVDYKLHVGAGGSNTVSIANTSAYIA